MSKQLTLICTCISLRDCVKLCIKIGWNPCYWSNLKDALYILQHPNKPLICEERP
jgi:hypothetical protein